MNSYYTNLLNDDQYGTEDDIVSSLPTPVQESGQQQQQTHKPKRARTKNFSIQEDMMLISAWQNVSMDAIQGNNQTQLTYWSRIAAFFHENKKFISERTPSSLMNRWSAIQLSVSKFQGYYNQIDGRNQSGISEQDKVTHTLDMFQSLQKCVFPYMHCWTELRYAPKFASNLSKKKSKTTENVSPASSPSTSGSTNLSDLLESEQKLDRPLGRKASKELFVQAKKKEKEAKDEEIKALLLELKEAQEAARNARTERMDHLLKLEMERQEREVRNETRKRKKEEREEMLYEERIIGTDVSKMDEVQAEYYNSLRAAIMEKRRNTGFQL